MNHRVLELLKTPKSIQSEDLHLLEEEINSFPYIQNIRALYLYGVHLYDKDNYQKVLSTTAAYTTDKKILYQLINGKIQQKTKVESLVKVVKEKIIPAENPLQLLLRSKASAFPLKREETPVDVPIVDAEPEIVEKQTQLISDQETFGVTPAPKLEAKEVFVNGERNRILFEGEEDFLENDDVETIDLESTLESGSIITYKAEKKEQSQIYDKEVPEQKEKEAENAENFTSETIIEEEKITQEAEKEEVSGSSDLSFHETETFLPDVQISSNEEQEKVQVDDNSPLDKTAEDANFTHEKIIHEDEISSKEEESVNDEAELSFHGMESFLPEVKIEANKPEERIAEISQPNVSKHEDEMRRLIEEVERKMKEKAASEKTEKQEEPENTGHDISFAETQSFEVKPQPEVEKEAGEIDVQPQTSEELNEEPAEYNEDVEEKAEVHSVWKPMSFESNLPDSLLNKSEEIKSHEADIPLKETIAEDIKAEPKEETVSEPEQISEPAKQAAEIIEPSENIHTEEKQQEAQDENKEEAPVMNVSFFGSGWTIAQPEKQQEIHHEEEKMDSESENVVKEQKSTALDSNIPGFINTWQSWLKIDRSEGVQKEKAEIKNKVIETFIETNPKISQLKEESNFVVKEKGDDISHLMTETLANLYFEQKLYTKAIKAFEILIKKTPEKKEYYEGRIQEIKDFRTKG
ncbi:hypothetical protein SAMN05421856_104418 [Chryseobacterium taichungense]|uniref:Tetratricopeptide repeat-containing protein n=1 Tax=Chryseobacterium taichungense TaxID=295069 RepID=A0A1H7ZQ47_9FLAO|nr:hypothetical protein [Chryseobacterium taichungense]SEM60423.1 hypothetical protein SAMN05421856_104418 [Chryseobacterium taichungense]